MDGKEMPDKKELVTLWMEQLDSPDTKDVELITTVVDLLVRAYYLGVEAGAKL